MAAIHSYQDAPFATLVDVGCADRLMTRRLKSLCPSALLVAVERSLPLLRLGSSPTTAVNGDAGQLPLRDSSADVVVMAAVVEHLLQPEEAIEELYRVIRPGGLCVVTSPNPIIAIVAQKIGLLRDDTHAHLHGLHTLGCLLEGAGFEVIAKRRFMLSPMAIPLERALERALCRFRLSGLLANQIAVGRRPNLPAIESGTTAACRERAAQVVGGTG